ncbi:NAD-binding protein [Burkholderia sp. BCC0419]|uniref:NAD-binding protein n=1 Tax=Burkholderia sp. BCC0419 TaxID=486878 RepID=UPI00158B1CE5|nr:NAD-binding protein [Burkholderia sp. BCC0419]
MSKIGFIGLGIMGRPMAGHLVDAGYALCVLDRGTVPPELIEKGTIEAVSEAMVFASKAGADPERVRQALLGGFANSRILEIQGERMVKRPFEPGFRISLHQKDLNLALEGARSLRVSLPCTALCQQLLTVAAARGDGDADHSAVVKVLELLADHELGASA